jgi:alkylation response protein AidB-like acyl-CoA dehydrogenase
VLGATVPTEHGGLGVDSLHDVAVTLAAVAAADAGTALALHMQLSRGFTTGYDWRQSGSEVWAGLLRSMAAGTALVCGAVAEPGRDYEHVETEVRPDGPDCLVMSGRKIFATLSSVATHFIVRARTPPRCAGRPPRPKRAVIYAAEVPKGLATEFRFRKSDGEGNVEVRQHFWHLPADLSLTVPTPLIYADLVASADPRLAEAAADLRESDALLRPLDRS